LSRIGIGVIGCGDISRARYFPAIAAFPEFELRGMQSRTPSVCEPLAAKYGGKIFADLEDLLRAPEIEAVVVATPHPSHADIAVRCLLSGKHVLCEKPIATSLADANRMLQAAERSNRVFMALPFDASPPVVEAKRLLAAGAIGRVSSADSVLAHRGPKHAPWFFDRDKAQWGVAADLGIYLASQLTYLFGPAASVRGRVNTAFPERVALSGETIKATVDDNVAAVLEWPDKTLATIRVNWCSPSDHRNVINETRIYGTEGLIHISPSSKVNPIVVYSPDRPVEGATPIEFNGAINWYKPSLPEFDGDRVIMQAFATQIAGGPAPDGASTSRQRHVIEIIDKLYASSASGTTAELETNTAA
jgi:UDP-N-acetylglucosamine 3-dehydrogenase